MEKHQGQCACGEIHYHFTGEPIDSAFCYCTDCQKHSGTDKFFGLWVTYDQLVIDQGKPASYTRIGDGDHEVTHHFCSTCGTNLFINVHVANIYSVAAGTLDNHESFKPNHLIYTASATKWAVFPEGVEKHAQLPPMYTQ